MRLGSWSHFLCCGYRWCWILFVLVDCFFPSFFFLSTTKMFFSHFIEKKKSGQKFQIGSFPLEGREWPKELLSFSPNSMSLLTAPARSSHLSPEPSLFPGLCLSHTMLHNWPQVQWDSGKLASAFRTHTKLTAALHAGSSELEGS